jgi:hypothetical protein
MAVDRPIKVRKHVRRLIEECNTSISEGAPAKTYPVSHKASLNQDKSTYRSDEQEQLIELSSFNICSALQTSQII